MEETICEQIRLGKGASTIKTILNAATEAHTIGIAEQVPKRMWKLFQAAKNLDDRPIRIWGTFEALQTMAQQAKTHQDWYVVGCAVLATTYGLRISEAASITPECISVLLPDVRFRDTKVYDEVVRRPFSREATRWAQVMRWIATRQWDKRTGEQIMSTGRIEITLKLLLRNTKFEHIRWHAWRRLGAATLWRAGVPLGTIKSWFRWKSTKTAMLYCEAPSSAGVEKRFTAPTAPREHVTVPVEHWFAGQLRTDARGYWPEQANRQIHWSWFKLGT